MSDYSFQNDAISLIEKDFKLNTKAKNLLVIPTGGGKTLTALRSIDNLIHKKLLVDKDLVIWAVHSITLKDQTLDVLNGKLLIYQLLQELMIRLNAKKVKSSGLKGLIKISWRHKEI